jgi:hypothetical protein
MSHSQLMKKNRGNILNRLIHESLSKSRGRVSDIVACHLYTDEEMGEKTAKPTERVTSVEYFDEPGLSESIPTMRSDKNGHLHSEVLHFEHCTWAFDELVWRCKICRTIRFPTRSARFIGTRGIIPIAG